MARGVKLDYTNEDLRKAIQSSNSWRGVLRQLGYATSNGYLSQRLRHRAADLGIDYSHFPVRQIWSVEELEAAVRKATNWGAAAVELGVYPNGANVARLKAAADRAGISYVHFPSSFVPNAEMPFTKPEDERHLWTAATAMAAAWFLRRGYGVSYPLEPRPYDLVVEGNQSLYRVQVKTTRTRDRTSGVPVCGIGRVPRRDGRKLAYDPSDIDFFFIVDVSGDYYIIPIQDVIGLKHVSLSTVQHRKVAAH